MKKLLLLSLLLLSCNAHAQEAQDQGASAADAPQQAGGRWSYQTPIDEGASDAETCRLKLERFRLSAACFQPYRIGKFMPPEAFAHCTEYRQPVECMTRH